MITGNQSTDGKIMRVYDAILRRAGGRPQSVVSDLGHDLPQVLRDARDDGVLFDGKITDVLVCTLEDDETSRKVVSLSWPEFVAMGRPMLVRQTTTTKADAVRRDSLTNRASDKFNGNAQTTSVEHNEGDSVDRSAEGS